MPKKSKKGKIIAEQRRKLYTPSAAQQAPTFQFQLEKKHYTPVSNQLYSNQTELSAIKHDLTKTLLLAFVAVSAELTLYWLGRGKI